MIIEHRVIFGDTDQMGVVYYANYLRFFEAARGEFLRRLGRSYRDFDEWGVALPVVEAHCRYLRPARYEDLLEIDTQITELGGASVRFQYAVRLGEQLLAEGWTLHACIDVARGRPKRLPAPLKSLIGAVPRG